MSDNKKKPDTKAAENAAVEEKNTANANFTIARTIFMFFCLLRYIIKRRKETGRTRPHVKRAMPQSL